MSGHRPVKGRLIAVCGIDGSGKSTQTGLLARRAEAEGRAVRQVSFPRYGKSFFGDLIERYLRGEFGARAGDVNPYLAALPYACDRWEASAQMRRWLDEGCLVLCNRYVPANQAHQGSKLPAGEARRRFLKWVDTLEYGVFVLPRPDLHLLLDLPAELCAGLMSGRRAAAGTPDAADIHERDRTYLERTAGVYRELAAAGGASWEVIRCWQGMTVLPPEQIADRAWDAVCKVLYNGAA